MPKHRFILLLSWLATTLLLIAACELTTNEPTPEQTPLPIVRMGEPIALPPTVSPENDIVRRAEQIVPAEHSAIIIPESAFNQALEHSPYYQVDPLIQDKAVELVAQANDSGTLGVLAPFQATGQLQPFQGTVFIVVRDPALTPDGKIVQSTNYFVAAVELSGLTPWSGVGVSFAKVPALSVSDKRCCGPATLCIQNPIPPGVCDPHGRCPALDFGVTPYFPPSLSARQQNNLRLIGLAIYWDKGASLSTTLPSSNMTTYANRGGPASITTLVAGQNMPQVFDACTKVRDKFCDSATPSCGPGDVGHVKDGQGCAVTSEGSSPSCLGNIPGKPIVPRNVPLICTRILIWEGGPPECGGYCPLCGQPPSNKLPPGCALKYPSDPYSDICKTSEERQAAREGESGLMWASLGLKSGTRCERTGPKGTQTCTTCQDATHCYQYTDRPAVDPDVASGTAEPRVERQSGEQQDLEVCQIAETGCMDVKDPEKKKPKPKSTPPEQKKEEPKSPAEQPPTSPDAASYKAPPQPRRPLTPKPGSTPTPPAPKEGPKPEDHQWRPPPNDLNFPEFFRDSDKPGQAADPVLIGDGSFHIEQTDLSFAGPVHPLEFRRIYNSRSRLRSVLGSNWTHNWDMYLQPLRADNIPSWAFPYCAGSEITTTCLLLHDGTTGGVQLFFLDMGSRLYMPQAGSTDTIAATAPATVTQQITGTSTISGTLRDGWALRRADGHELYFNGQGYLVNDRDRFGNGFRIEYERTPLFELYDYYCSPAALTARNETKYSRRCAVLAYLVDDAVKPLAALDDKTQAPWVVTEVDYPLPSDPVLRQRLGYARAYFLYVLSLNHAMYTQTFGRDAQTVFGNHLLRPTRVVDDLGRSLEFSYYHASPVSGSSALTPTFDFASTPHAELLQTVRGPVGTTVRFSYARPITYPAELDESFLVQVERHDSPSVIDVLAAPDRRIEYQYQWPGGTARSYDYDLYATTVYSKYLAFYDTFVGCGFKGFLCGNEYTPPQLSLGNPQELAWLQRNAYISDIADNIIQMLTSGVSDSETRYSLDPMALHFDRVTAQRYGSSHAQQNVALVPPDAPTDNWQTLLPKTTMVYTPAGPALGGLGDLTDSLPKEIRDRYPLEVTPPGLTPPLTATQVITSMVGVSGTSSRGDSITACNYTLMETLRVQLPGYRLSWPYYEPVVPPYELANLSLKQLRRSRLGCDQLAVAQLSDPTHNDLISTMVPITSTPALTDHVAIRLIGERPIVASNMNRICTWVQLIDRDGTTHYYGLNYRGQVLVDAVQEFSGQFIFTERLYNADGMVVQERRPTRGSQPWQMSAGATTYSYDEIDPSGNRGWNDWLPVFWSRRMNLLRVEERAAGSGVTDDLEAVSTQTTTSVGRFQAFSYEPLFNQLKSVEEGSVERWQGPIGPITDVVHFRQDYIFDYQELALTSTATLTSTFKPVLDHLKPWGFAWLAAKGPANTDTYSYTAIASWQLPLAFYDRDLNDDGVQGFIWRGHDYERARGVPVLAIQRSASGLAEPQVTTITWAPHGLPAAISGPDNAITIYEYYSIGSPTNRSMAYGHNRSPTDQDVSIAYRGLLGRVLNRQFVSAYDSTYGPPDAPCAALAGPYQWLLPSNCAAPRAELQGLGLPPAAVDAILSTTAEGSPDRWLTTTFTYAEIGLPRYTSVMSRETHFMYDADGRERLVTDPLGSTTTITYTIRGDPEQEIRIDKQGQRLSESNRVFDEEGRVIYECAAQRAGGCGRPGTPNPTTSIIRRYEYWPEGSLREAIDPEGLITEYRYNERQLLIEQRSHHPNFPTTPPRVETYAYDVDDNLFSVRYGDPSGPISTTAVLSETYTYDGLQRTTSYTDTRGYVWQYAYSNRDLVTRVKRDVRPYHSGASPIPSWETELHYDGFGQLAQRYDKTVLTAEYSRTNGGLVYTEAAAGRGPTYTTYDLLGRPVWSRDAAGNQTVVTLQQVPYIATSAVIRVGRGQARHTTATITQFNGQGLPAEEIEYGSGDERRWSWKRDGAGRVLEMTNPEGYLTKTEYNLLGQPRNVHEQRSAGRTPEFDTASFELNRRGQIEKITDPSGQITEIQYDPYGAVRSRTIPGQPIVGWSFSYDNLGRLDVEQRGTIAIKYGYDARGDPVTETLLDRSGPLPMVEREFDDLGRVRRTKTFNVALGWLPVADRTAQQEFDYDELGRIRAETLQVGAGAVHRVSSNWKVMGGTWQRQLRYTFGSGSTEWWETFDEIERLADIQEARPHGPGQSIAIDWLGDLYIGRDQQQTGSQSPFRERREIDHFGRTIGWRYSAIDTDQNGNPVRLNEGATYCGNQWDASQCARPLLTIDVLRDVMGRIASLNWRYGHPVFNNGALVTTNHPLPWRGYTYDVMGRLDQLWEHAGVNNPVVPIGLASHHVSRTDIQLLGQGSDHWQYRRETAVGGTTAIINTTTGTERWALTTQRGSGHQIQQIKIAGITRSLTYDSAGQIQTDGIRSYTYDPHGHLASVIENGVVLEAYAYSDDGRLAAVFSGSHQTPDIVFAYDGNQMVAAYDGSNKPLWEAVWGPGTDQLLLWRGTGASDAYIPLTDHRNSIVAAWNARQQRLRWTVEYNPEGRLLVQDASGRVTCREEQAGQICTNPSGMPFGFASAWRSPASGLVYMRNRWYSPELGQFISHDPLGYEDSYNLYSYVGFDPINGWDPWGADGKGFTSVAETGEGETHIQEHPMAIGVYNWLIRNVMSTLFLPAYLTGLGSPEGLEKNRKLDAFIDKFLYHPKSMETQRLSKGTELMMDVTTLIFSAVELGVSEAPSLASNVGRLGTVSESLESAGLRGWVALDEARSALPRALELDEYGMNVAREYSRHHRPGSIPGVGGPMDFEGRQQYIDKLLSEELSGVKFKALPEYNPNLKQLGVATKKTDFQPPVTEIGPSAFYSRQELRNTLIHEDIHHRLWNRGVPEPHHPKLDSYINAVIDRFAKMKGLKP